MKKRGLGALSLTLAVMFICLAAAACGDTGTVSSGAPAQDGVQNAPAGTEPDKERSRVEIREILLPNITEKRGDLRIIDKTDEWHALASGEDQRVQAHGDDGLHP